MTKIETLIEGSEKLTSIFGFWPSFHDAEVIELHLWRGDAMTERAHPRFPVLTAKIHVWELTNEIDAHGYHILKHHTLATLRFHDVLNLEIKGFNQQNAIFGLSFTIQENLEGPWKQSFAIQFESALDMEAGFRCSRVEVLDAIPWV
jgi:immunity protein 50 of polymorphic toxin system